ncbi:hypothetical protein [Enterococcus rivorum]|uniref:Uncharacterized protein n=1 Tax=Enterococcus rivorum TaxID=762845 RepID=A0A1E5L0F0_9ENTE|nr:hypothetical protein [Enterococcus rivorum]MBP2098873.1 hypothetical protein [Enterococcus rivorum]OEH83600.1 hypothetical protein BCR26_08975 [Enterococcus rivorum]
MNPLILTDAEANYLSGLLKNETVKNQAIMRKNNDLKGFFEENNKMNGSIGRKITNSLKKDRQKRRD